ncbi:MAG: bacillithiol biosynthesis cysteine-adding enzyme BshC [Flavobacteriales bacterium]|nr:bacillithiol biosynthesis cysteine-adding enzyme BshC [Flavobacteriales bacterium]
MEQSTENQTHNLIEIDYSNTDFFSDLIKKYLSNQDFPNQFVNRNSDADNAKEVVQNPQFSPNYRKGLVEEILKQYEQSNIHLNESSPVYQNIVKLQNENCVCITTGQQIHIFLGPMFVAHKLLSVCLESDEFNEQQSEYESVPIFWMATEDHDFEEINSVSLYNEKLTWDIESKGFVGRLAPQSLLPLVNFAKQRIDQTPENLHFIAVCETAYTQCKTFAQATRQIIHTLYGHTGIIVFDGDNTFCKKQFVNIFKNDLFKHDCSEAIDATINELKANKIKPPINTRPSNTFFLHDNQRLRLEKNENNFRVVGSEIKYNTEEINDFLLNQPEKFSPNALLRPLYQQVILPNISYIAGAAEFMYWIELKLLLFKFGTLFPKLIIRPSTFYFTKKNLEFLRNADIPIETIFYSKEKLSQLFVNKYNEKYNNLSNRLSELDDLMESLFMDESMRQYLNASIKTDWKNVFKKTSNSIKSMIDNSIEMNSDYQKVIKIKSKIWHENYNQERQKSILESLSSLKHLLSASSVTKNSKINILYLEN